MDALTASDAYGRTPAGPRCTGTVRTVHTTAGFRFEAQMLPVVAGSAGDLLKRRRADQFTALYEVPTATGVPDLVLVRFNAGVIDRREADGLGPVTDATECAVLSALRAGPSTAAETASAVGMTVRHVAGTVLPGLADRGFVSATCGVWSCNRGLRAVTDGIVAVEAKRSQWQRASSQARRYCNFANESFVVIDALHRRRVEPWAARLAASGIGVAVAGVDGSVDVIARSGWAQPRARWHALLAGERAWDLHRRNLTSGPTFPVFGRTLTEAAPPTSAGVLVPS